MIFNVNTYSGSFHAHDTRCKQFSADCCALNAPPWILQPSKNPQNDFCSQFYWQALLSTQKNIFESRDLIINDCTLDRARRRLIAARVNETEKFFELCKKS